MQEPIGRLQRADYRLQIKEPLKAGKFRGLHGPAYGGQVYTVFHHEAAKDTKDARRIASTKQFCELLKFKFLTSLANKLSPRSFFAETKRWGVYHEVSKSEFFYGYAKKVEAIIPPDHGRGQAQSKRKTVSMAQARLRQTDKS